MFKEIKLPFFAKYSYKYLVLPAFHHDKKLGLLNITYKCNISKLKIIIFNLQILISIYIYKFPQKIVLSHMNI